MNGLDFKMVKGGVAYMSTRVTLHATFFLVEISVYVGAHVYGDWKRSLSRIQFVLSWVNFIFKDLLHRHLLTPKCKFLGSSPP